MRGLSFILFTVLAYSMLFVAVQNGFGVTEISAPASAEVAGVSTVTNLPSSGNPIIDLINKNRVNSGKKQLQIENSLNQVARTRGNDMITNSYYSHINSTGQDYSSLLLSPASFSCENLDLTDTSNPNAIVQDWLNSKDGHRECLLDSRATNVGISLQEYPISGNSDSKTFITVLILSSN